MTLAGSLDFESAKSYELTLVADDGDNKVSETVFTMNVGDINEAPVVSTLAATAFAKT